MLFTADALATLLPFDNISFVEKIKIREGLEFFLYLEYNIKTKIPKEIYFLSEIIVRIIIEKFADSYKIIPDTPPNDWCTDMR